MRCVKKMERGPGLTFTNSAEPTYGDNDVLIQVKYAAICGTDVHIDHWDQWSQQHVKPPVITGHEFMGEIVAMGKNVRHFQIGQRVSAEGHIVCGVCPQCRTGKGHVCKNVEMIGVTRDGGFAEYVSVPMSNVWAVHPDMIDRYCALYDPLGNAMHTVMAQNVSLKRVLITGAGSIGLFAIPIVKSLGATQIIVVEPNEYKRTVAKSLGADLVLSPFEDKVLDHIVDATYGQGADVLLEMSGFADTIRLGLKAVANGGEVSLLGIAPGEVSLDLNNDIIFKALTVRGITGRRIFDTWYQSENFMLRYAHTLDPILTHVLRLDQIEEGIALMTSNQGIKILIDVQKTV